MLCVNHLGASAAIVNGVARTDVIGRAGMTLAVYAIPKLLRRKAGEIVKVDCLRWTVCSENTGSAAVFGHIFKDFFCEYYAGVGPIYVRGRANVTRWAAPAFAISNGVEKAPLRASGPDSFGFAKTFQLIRCIFSCACPV